MALERDLIGALWNSSVTCACPFHFYLLYQCWFPRWKLRAKGKRVAAENKSIEIWQVAASQSLSTQDRATFRFLKCMNFDIRPQHFSSSAPLQYMTEKRSALIQIGRSPGPKSTRRKAAENGTLTLLKTDHIRPSLALESYCTNGARVKWKALQYSLNSSRGSPS